jgi:hypothetical protein
VQASSFLPGADGRTPWRPAADRQAPASSESTGLRIDMAPDGAMALHADRWLAHGLQLNLGFGQAAIAQAALTDLHLTLGRLDGSGMGLRSARIAEVALQGVDITASVAGLRQVSATPGAWQLQPLAGLEGTMRAFITDAAWIVDADITVPLKGGVLDFDQVVVEHVGPNSSMGVSRGGLYVDAPNLGRRYLVLFTGADVPGARFEHRSTGFGARVSERGAIDLSSLVQGLLAGAGGAPWGKPANEQVEATLDRTRLTGELHLGDGWLGTDARHIALAGQAHGRNRISLLAEALGRRLAASVPEFSAAEAAFDLGGLKVRCGTVSAQLHVELSDLRTQPQVRMTAPQMTLRDVSVE